MPKPEKNAAEAGLEFLESVGEMLDLLDGYRSQLLNRNYSAEAAEQMVVHMHAALIHGITGQKS